MRSREIKDLCIAKEALSRIPGYEAEKQSSRINDLINDLLKEEETKAFSPAVPPPAPCVNADDEIPF